MTSADREREYKELFELTTYLLTHFQGTKKTFYLGHWEGDWSLLGGFAKDDEPSDVAINGMVEWLNVRQKAIDDAKAQHRDSDVTAYGYVEVNLVRKALEGRKAVTNSVLPRIDVDYVSYSSWDSLAMDAGAPAMARRLTESLSYIESKLRRKQVPGKRVFIGEFGFPLDTVKSRAAQVQYTRAVLDAAVEWDCPFVLYWQMYENEADEGGLGRGQGLIDNRGDPTLVYAMLSTLLKDANRFVSETNARTKRQPSERDYSQFVRAWLAGRNPLVTKPTAQSIRRGQADPAGDLTQRLKGTKWRNSNNASFEWTKDGRLLHNGKEREWKVLDDKRLQVVFGSDHKDTLEFDGSLKTFKQLIRGGPNSLEGKLVSSPSR